MFGLAAIASQREGAGTRRGLVFFITLLSLACAGTAKTADLMIHEDALARVWISGADSRPAPYPIPTKRIAT